MYRILIADDEPWMRKAILAMIDWEAYNFYLAGEACHGGDALTKIEQFKPDIVISDIRMPGMNGLEMLKKINQIPYRPAVIFISGYSCFDYAQEAVNLGAAGYLLKPVSKAALLESLKKTVQMLERHRQRQEFREIDGNSALYKQLTAEALLEIRNIFENTSKNAVLEFADKLERTMKLEAVTVREAYFMCYQLTAAILNLCIVSDEDSAFDADVFSVYRQIDNCKTKEEMAGVICRFIRRCHRLIEKTADNAQSGSIQAIKKFIDGHYMDELSLDKLAAIYHFHPAYLSALFRDSFGQSFINYLTAVRLAKAKELLCLGERTAVVAQAVGYSNAKYFARVFRKSQGVSPKEYRERNLKIQA